MEKNQHPRILFKYRHFDKEGYHLKSLDELYLAPPESFNDPFDTALPVLYHSSGTPPDEILAHMRRTNPETNKSHPLPDSRIVEEWKRFIRSIPEDIGEAQEFDQRQAEMNARETGVFSLAEGESSILMWSHYGFHHTGFCIGYRTPVLYEELRKTAEVVLMPMQYLPRMPIVNPYDPNLSIDDWFSPFTVKYLDWYYEKEWRLLLLRGANTIVPIPEQAVESVYLGMRIKKFDEELIISKLRARKFPVNLFRATRQFNSFELKFERQEYIL